MRNNKPSYFDPIIIALLCNDMEISEFQVDEYYKTGSISIGSLFIRSSNNKSKVIQELKSNKEKLCILCANKAIFLISKPNL